VIRYPGSVTDRYSTIGGSDPGWTTSTGSWAICAATSMNRMTGAQPTLLEGCGSFPKGWAVLVGGSAPGLIAPSWASAVPARSPKTTTNIRCFMARELMALEYQRSRRVSTGGHPAMAVPYNPRHDAPGGTHP